jgi:hypothetical protein
MRALALLPLALLLALPAAAQPMDFPQPFQVRVGAGDIPTTAAAEPDGWSVEQRWRIGSPPGNVTFPIPEGHRLVEARCDCNASAHDTFADRVVFRLPPGTGMVTLTVTTTTTRTAAFALDLPVPEQPALAIVYAPQGMEARGPGASSTLPGASGPHTITTFGEAEPLPQRLWLAVLPAGGATVAQPDAPMPWLWLGAAFLAGVLLWALLVSRGMVQARSRRQVAQVAAHEAIAAKEPKPVLEARKRALMAALKEVEVAKMNGEMEASAYDTVKADLKKQTVTVMRALEEGA